MCEAGNNLYTGYSTNMFVGAGASKFIRPCNVFFGMVLELLVTLFLVFRYRASASASYAPQGRVCTR